MKTILITGAAGFIGSNLAQALISDNKIIGFDNINDYYDPSLKEYRLSKLSYNPNFTFKKGDLADKQAVDSIFKQYQPDIVVNFAAESHVDRSIENPEVFLQTNIIGTSILLDACEDYMLNRNTAEKIISEVIEVVKGWRELATRLGIPKREMDMFAGVLDTRWNDCV